uniref:Serpentine Receptor, class T n=1 Tax=Rhabditophanes sp. KR3021 TaxID=114890 RepID=A0AC35TVT7_9BILA
MILEFVLKPSYIHKYYSCNYLTPEEWEREKNPNFLLGLLYIFLGTVTISLYIPIICVLITKDMVKNNFYKLILSITIVDIAELCMSSLASGYFTIEGSLYCSHPILNFIVAFFVLTTWCANSILAAALALNRCLDAYNSKWANALFGGKKVYLWIFGAVSYGVSAALFTPPMIYTSKQWTMFSDPYINIDKIHLSFENPDQYNNWILVINNVTLFFVLPTLYFTFSILMFQKTRTEKISKLQRSLFLQSFLLCCVTFVTSFIYDLMQFALLNRLITMCGHFLWLSSSCVGAYVYLIFNATIRNYVIDDFVPISVQKCINIQNKAAAVKFRFNNKTTII